MGKLESNCCSMEKKKEINSSLPQNSIFNGIRSLRLTRKCKQRNVNSGFDLEEVDDDEAWNPDQAGKSKKDKVKNVSNRENCKATHGNSKMVASPEEVSLSPDKLLGHNGGLEAVTSKKRKVDMKSKDIGDFASVNTANNSKGHQTKADSMKDNLKRYSNRKKVNSDVEAKKTNNIIEIDGEGSEKDDPIKEGTSVTPKVNCPMCNKLFPSDEINDHAYTCQGPQTQTRSQQMNNSIPMYNARAWESACLGLHTGNGETKEPTEHLDHVGTSENKFDNKERDRTKQNNSKDDMKMFSKNMLSDIKQKQDVGSKPNKLFTAKTTGYANLSLPAAHNKSAQELMYMYGKTLHKINKNPPAKQMRTFGESPSNELEMVQCARCDEYIADDQLKHHTDNCLDKSVVID